MSEQHTIKRRVSYTDVPHKDPNLRIVLVTEAVTDNHLDPTGLQVKGFRSAHQNVTAEFMRDADDALWTAGQLIEPYLHDPYA